MNIKIYSDIACPYCYIGLTRLMRAINNNFNIDMMELEFKPFQLNPNLPDEPEATYYENLASNYGVSLEEAEYMANQVANFAEEDGINLDFENLKNTNTFNGHKLIYIASEADKGLEASMVLFDAYFNKGINIADKDELIKLGIEIGLNENSIRNGLDSKELDREINAQVIASQFSGISSVPYFIFDNYYSLKGAQPVEVFEEVLEQTLEDMDEV